MGVHKYWLKIIFIIILQNIFIFLRNLEKNTFFYKLEIEIVNKRLKKIEIKKYMLILIASHVAYY